MHAEARPPDEGRGRAVTGDPSGGPSRTGTALEVVHDRLRQQITAARSRAEEAARLDTEGVHQMRVALRRLRSALVTFRPLFDARVTEPLRAEIKWLAGVLGAVRDTQVMEEHLDALVAGEPEELVVGPVRRRLDDQLDEELRVANEQLAAAMHSARYEQLMSDLDALATSPPWAVDRVGAGRGALRRRIRHDFRRMRRAVQEAATADSRAQRDERLHEVRKSAKRVRYAAETVEPAFGEDALRFAEAVEAIQEVLGEQHDAVTALDRLRDAARNAEAAGDSAFTFGRLHALTQRRSDDLVIEFAAVWDRARDKQLRRWLR